MNWNRRDFIATMEQGKRAADARRNRGLGGGKAAKGHVRAVRHDEANWHSVARVTWASCKVDAIEDYLRAVYPERYEEFA